MDCMRNNFNDGVLLDGRYRTVAPLNHGSFGMVFKAVDTWTGEMVALKCLVKPNAVKYYTGDISVDDRSEELDIHRKLGRHPNIIELVNHFETEYHLYLVLEFCENGDLYEAIRVGRGPGRTEHVRQCLLDLIDAVEHMHKNGVYHRDIKPENIMLGKDGTLKLGDFGLATMDDWSFEAGVGSDRYMAPEQFDPANTGYSPAKADIWAIGICVLNILFSRNPFAAPTFSDPLFRDFANDRQTLFDVFPKMSQDTFEVISHSAIIDPNRRSLSALRDAVARVVSFTTDDETLDDFCNEKNVVVTASANRMPLRTPSVNTPHMEPTGAFPWARALAMSPPVRQLSVIPDTETPDGDVGSGPGKPGSEWFAVKPDDSSVASFVDSGLGVSLNSTDMQLKPDMTRYTRSKAMQIAGSVPMNIGRPASSLAATFGRKRDVFSKSWSDLWDEEEEENAVNSDHEFDMTPSRGRQVWRSDSDGQDTPRQGLVEMRNPETINNSRNRTPVASESRETHVSEHTGFVFEDHDSGLSTPTGTKRPQTSRLANDDKWSALGDRRRATPTPSKSPAQSVSAVRKRGRAGSWRARNMEQHTPRSPFSFVNDATSTTTFNGVLDHFQRQISTGRSKSKGFALNKASPLGEQAPHPWLYSKDWRAQQKTLQRESEAHDASMSGWRRALHL